MVFTPRKRLKQALALMNQFLGIEPTKLRASATLTMSGDSSKLYRATSNPSQDDIQTLVVRYRGSLLLGSKTTGPPLSRNLRIRAITNQK